jgi:Ca2+/Na+ antiporter
MYRLFSKIRTNDTPATNAMIFISVCEFANGITILNLAKIPLKGDTQNEVISIAIIISLTVMLINYFILYKSLEYLCIKYKNETNKQKVVGVILLCVYILGSSLLVYLTAR